MERWFTGTTVGRGAGPVNRPRGRPPLAYHRSKMEIAPNVHAVQLLGSNGFLLTERRLTLIDAGLAGSRPMLLRYLRRIGRSIDELERIICTHGHPDHIGGVRELVDAGVEVLVHPADLEGLGLTFREAMASDQRGTWSSRLIKYLTRHPENATGLLPGSVLPVLGGLEVIHTPGHTPGSVCLYAPRLRLLFTGDVLQVRLGRLAFASVVFSHDAAQARTSMRRLAELDVDIIAFSHYRPMRDGASAALARLAARAKAG